MPLAPGQLLSCYEILGSLGAGGMGEVYLARDTRLEREVAIKVLPEELADDVERLRRFEREAKTLASLNHPNVAGIHGVDQEGDVSFLALELVPGEDLAERLSRGPLPVEEALDVCRQIAEGLEAAHEAGVVHRDLKPANVRVTPEGVVKILDFGLAKPLRAESTPTGRTTAETDSFLMTEEGLVLGTPTYMSPEQARGKPVDRRTDIWAFGCVLYECLTGRRAFGGDSVTDVLTAIVGGEPEWSGLPPLRDRVRELLERSLAKDPRNRLRDMGEARIALERAAREPSASGGGAVAVAPSKRRLPALPLVAIAALAAVAGLLIGRLLVSTPAANRPPTARVDVPLPVDKPVAAGTFLNPIALSPDGRTLVYVGVQDGTRRLFRRPLAKLEADALPGTEGAEAPFFSPDGESVGFWAGGCLKRVALAGGLPQTIHTMVDCRGATWGPDGTIVVSPSQDGSLWRVSAEGGEMTQLTRADGGLHHRLPTFLPGGRAVLFAIGETAIFSHEQATLAAVLLDTGEVRVLAEEVGIDARYAAGHVFYVQGGALLARPFDPDRLEFTGPVRTMLQGVQVQSNTGAARYALSADGSIAFLPGEAVGDDIRLTWVDRDGDSEDIGDDRDAFRWPKLTVDRRRIYVVIIGGDRDGYWIGDAEDAALTLLPHGGFLAWAPGGRHAYRVLVPGNTLELVNVFTGDEPRVVYEPEPHQTPYPTSVGADGESVLFSLVERGGSSDIYVLEPGVDGEKAARPFVATDAYECAARFSPDGNWVAFVSDTTGRFEVYLTDWPSGRTRRQVSTEGGREPLWSVTGDELFFRSGETMFAAAVTTSPDLAVAAPRVLFTGDYEGLLGFPDVANYDVGPDDRFLMLRSRELSATRDRVALLENAVTGSN